MATRRTTPNTFKESNVPSTNTPRPTRLTPQQLEERREKGLCFNCDSNYSKGHKCGEKKLFNIDCEGEEVEDQEPSQTEENIRDHSGSDYPYYTLSCIGWNLHPSNSQD